MQERWHRSNQAIPEIDRNDYIKECPLFNQNKKPSPDHQQYPEYTQVCYKRLRHQEEAFIMYNYFDENLQKKNGIQQGEEKLK